ncbi:uncharacterized protein SCODWIG_02999 [Saccharomycodes ludwigii]|uniref:PHD-type domain-containing protein n=1 Tax=Saccharomycodes ludwigii TaxID=36035 RepID=A0A376B969_9ASCO|nr:hypothetical protein SCDLUD_002131 [Saccharomycodes ludwigii]KAH3902311.1 hypothetical protein SCDLUD_002131 [Saccharomycodes ludwigii]SSD61238.1 uncharacterized protein SCODWIG_02999 [Saccharomycodes ludwigii]
MVNSDRQVYCICKKPDNGQLMVGCDGCDDWFHFKCLKITPNYKNLVYSFYCPDCENKLNKKTIWKRKCRLPNCFQPIATNDTEINGQNSKYCCEEHGIQYISSLIDRLENSVNVKVNGRIIGDNDLFVLNNIKDVQESTLERSHAHKETEVVTEISENGQIEERIAICNLQDNLDTAVKNKKNLERYIEWIKTVTQELDREEKEQQHISERESSSDSVTGKKNKTSNKKRRGNSNINNSDSGRKLICGYDRNLTFDKTKSCLLRNCSKHDDWIDTLMQNYENQIDKFQSDIKQYNYLRGLES